MSLTTPPAIQELQRKLNRKAKEEPRFRFYMLYDKVCRADILAHAWALCKANRGAPGVDGKTLKDIEAYGVERFLEEVGRELKEGTYRPEAVRRVMIPKADGGERPLGIPTVKDRVVQTAAKIVLEPIFEADFTQNAHGYRPGHSAGQDPFDFLGYTFGRCYAVGTGKPYLGVRPSRKRMARLRDRIRELTGPATLPQSVPELIGGVNRVLSGWAQYFSYGTLTKAYRAVDAHVLARVRHWMKRKHKTPNRGTRRYSEEWLHDVHGLLLLRHSLARFRTPSA